MPLWRICTKQAKGLYRFDWRALSLSLVLVASFPTRTDTLVNASQAKEPIESVFDTVPIIGFGFDGSTGAVGRNTGLPAARDTSELQTDKILKEIGKQTIDQPGHFLIAAAPIWMSSYLVGVPWYGWVLTPLLAYREWLKWPSKRWWDPPLDWAFLSLGVVVATCRRRLTLGSTAGLSQLQRCITRELWLRLATPLRMCSMSGTRSWRTPLARSRSTAATAG